MATPESKVKERVKRLLDKFGAYYFMPATAGYGRSGVPDIVGCWNGQFFAVECKAGNGKVTALQQRELDRIHLAHGKAFLVRDEDVDALNKYLTSDLGEDSANRRQSKTAD
jgi:Holliday junction resolvase